MPTSSLEEQAHLCFGCSPSNPQGLHLQFVLSTDPGTGLPTATAKVNLTRFHEGPPGYIHGGIIATVLDEAMSKLNKPLDAVAMTRHMAVEYLRPAPLHESLVVIGRHLRRTLNQDGSPGRKIFHEAALQSSDGAILARAEGLFIAIPAEVARTASANQVHH